MILGQHARQPKVRALYQPIENVIQVESVEKVDFRMIKVCNVIEVEKVVEIEKAIKV